MSTEYRRGPDSGQPRADQMSGQAMVPPPRAGQPPVSPYAPYAATGRPPSHRASGGAATGFTYLAAVLMVVGGLFSLLTGIEAAVRGSFYLVTNNYLYNINISNWGWIHIGIGAVVFLAGCALFAQQTWARWIGVFLAVISAVMNFLFIPRYPFWSILVIALDIVIIWALTAGQWREAY